MLTVFNHTLFNSTNAEMYVVPSNDRHLDDVTFNVTKLNFTWEVVEFENDTLSIQFNWTCAACISPEPDRDILSINFTNSTQAGFLFSPTLRKPLHEDW